MTPPEMMPDTPYSTKSAREKRMVDLILAVKREYFEQIKSGEKSEEYRLLNAYWIKRLNKITGFTRLIITLGYPSKHDEERRIVLPWRGYEKKTITHKHFGSDPVEVFAIKLR